MVNEKELSKKIIWCVYNHMPGGQLVATWRKTYSRKKKTGPDSTQEVIFNADDQIENLRSCDFVALKLKGKDIQKNKILVYPENDFVPEDGAETVLAWAIAQGAEQFKGALPEGFEQSKFLPVIVKHDEESSKRIDVLEERIVGIEASAEETKKGVQDILGLLQNKKKGESKDDE